MPKTIFDSLETYFSTEGMRGIFRGTMSGIFRNVPHSALVYTFYPKVNHFLVDHIPYFQTDNLGSVRMRKNKGEREEGSAKRTALLHAATGSIASILTTVFTHPMDVIRVRIAAQYQNIRYPNYASLFKQILRFVSPRKSFSFLFVSHLFLALPWRKKGGTPLTIDPSKKKTKQNQTRIEMKVFMRCIVGWE